MNLKFFLSVSIPLALISLGLAVYLQKAPRQSQRASLALEGAKSRTEVDYQGFPGNLGSAAGSREQSPAEGGEFVRGTSARVHNAQSPGLLPPSSSAAARGSESVTGAAGLSNGGAAQSGQVASHASPQMSKTDVGKESPLNQTPSTFPIGSYATVPNNSLFLPSGIAHAEVTPSKNTPDSGKGSSAGRSAPATVTMAAGPLANQPSNSPGVMSGAIGAPIVGPDGVDASLEFSDARVRLWYGDAAASQVQLLKFKQDLGALTH